MNTSDIVLDIDRLTVRFGGLVALDQVSFQVGARRIHSVIGPNGAGKSTVLNAIFGLSRASEGSIRLFGNDILGLRSGRIAALGAARTFQNTELFLEMSVLENVIVGAHRDAAYGLTGAALRTPQFQRHEKATREFAESILDDLGLGDERHTTAGNLPFGKKRLLELARALATRPKLILLDEPAAGLRALEIEQLNASLVRLRDERRLTILLIDHVMQVVMQISDVVTVLNFGRKISEGTPDVVSRDPEVRRAYLGSATAHAEAV